jgi:hypothetical protein
VAPQQDAPSAPGFDVFHINTPAGAGNGGDAGPPVPGNGRHASSVTTDNESALAETRLQRPPGGPDSDKPWLPRRVRQASLAPQLKTDAPLVPESTQEPASEPEDNGEPGDHGPDPADTRALVQSLQFGLDLAKKSDASGEDSWSTPADKSWPSTPDESWSPPASESWPSPAGNPDLAGRPEDDGGQ